MNLNPVSPLSSKPLSECDDAEVDAWLYLVIDPDPKKRAYVHKYSRTGLNIPYGSVSPYLPHELVPYTRHGSSAAWLMEQKIWPCDYVIHKSEREDGTYEFIVRRYTDKQIIARASILAAAIARAWLVAFENRDAQS